MKCELCEHEATISIGIQDKTTNNDVSILNFCLNHSRFIPHVMSHIFSLLPVNLERDEKRIYASSLHVMTTNEHFIRLLTKIQNSTNPKSEYFVYQRDTVEITDFDINQLVNTLNQNIDCSEIINLL